MVHIPQYSYRGQTLTFDEFYDLVVIGMAGRTDYLHEGPSIYKDGMVDYQRVAAGLGLLYEDDWLEEVKYKLQNRLEAIAEHDGGPDEPYKVYLNSGFDRIADLLYAKYYIAPVLDYMTFEEFRDALLFEFTGMVQDAITEDGIASSKRPVSYDLLAVADHFELPHEEGWIERVTEEWLENGLVVEVAPASDGKNARFQLTQKGYDRAQTLAEKLGEADGFILRQGSSKLFFSVDASHISRLGMELVAKQETAVAELVKNGYDADATNVDLIFSAGRGGETSLEIYDNGSGMNVEQLEAGFMRLSTPNKVEHPKSDLYGRQKAGRKGIGRFAAQRLGHRLVLETATQGMKYGLRLDIDWDQFLAERNLSSVPSTINRISKPFDHGTRLTILDLRDSWSDAQIERSHRHIAELIQPFPLAASHAAQQNDPGFKASFARERDGDLDIIADDWSVFFKHALAEIEGWVDENGRGFWTVKSERYSINDGPTFIGPRKDAPELPFPHLRNVRFKAYYYIDKETQRSYRSAVADKLQSSGGIRLYRNGFRVLPYGERFDDWLKLNASNLLRKVLPPHSNRNFLGFVEINDVDGANFEETSSREGLLENESFIELKDFVASVLKTAILPIAGARDRRLTTTDTRQKQRSPKGQADDIIARLNTLQRNAGGDPSYAAALVAVVDTIRESVTEIGRSGEALLEELGMMRVLATLGLTIGEFTHEIRLALETVKASASLLANNIGSGSTHNQASQLIDQIADFESYLTYFDATVRDNVSREVTALEIRDVVQAFIKVVSPKINRKELQLDYDFAGYSLFTRPMHKSEWASILINLFTNSLKAIRRAGVAGRIRIACGRVDGSIFVDFMDNGDGISEENRSKIFEPFFTTTAASGASEDDGTFAGMGMGLKIVKDIIETAHGSIQLVDAPADFSTRFRILIPEATDEELPENAY